MVVADLAPPKKVIDAAAPLVDAGAQAKRSPVWSLPPIKSGEPLSAVRFTVTLDEHSLLLDGQKLVPLPKDPLQGFDAEYKRSGKSDLYLLPLADAVKHARGGTGPDTAERARVELGPAVTYRLLTEILFTLGQSEVTGFNLVAPSAGGSVPAGDLSEIRITPPRLAGRSLAPSKPTLAITILAVQDGIGVKARGGNVAPGCTVSGPGLTFKNEAGGHYRLAELGPCLRRLKAASPDYADETNVTFTANPGVTLPDVFALLDVARGDNRDLFPDVLFGIAR